MVVLYLILALFALAGPVGLVLGIVALLRTLRLQKEFDRQRAERTESVSEASALAPIMPSPDVAVPPATAPPAATTAPMKPASEEALPTVVSGQEPTQPTPVHQPQRGLNLDVEAILGSQWLTWIGILAIFFGTAFFLGVDLGTHSLAGFPQVLIGLGVAGAFVAFGRVWSQKTTVQFLGLGLLGGGIALLYLVAYSAGRSLPGSTTHCSVNYGHPPTNKPGDRTGNRVALFAAANGSSLSPSASWHIR